MEKIYEESYKNKMSKKKNNFNVSVIFSFVVAVVAIVSLIVVGFNQISYSANTPNIGDEFMLYSKKSNGSPIRIFATGQVTFIVNMYYADENYTIPVFCIQKNVLPNINGNYKKNSEESNVGILYILNKSAIYGGPGIVKKNSISDESYNYLEYYATQVSLWVYLSEISTDKTLHGLGEDEEKIKGATNFSVSGTSEVAISEDEIGYNGNMYNDYIRSTVNEAKSASNVKSFSVSFSDKEKFEDKGDYYQTSSVTVNANPMEDLVNYTVSTSGVDGAIIVDGDGKELKGEINNNVFYVRIPKDKITDKTSELTVTVNATFNNYLEGYEYVTVENADSYQKVVTVNNISKTISKGDSIEISASPDTGLFKNKAIIYISIILSLFGISIVLGTIWFFKRSKLIKN